MSAFILALAFLPLFLPSHSSSTTAPATSFAAHSAGLPAGRFVANVGQLGNKDIIYYAAGRDSAVGFLKDAVILMITDGHPEPPPRLGRPWTDAVDAPAHGVAVRIAFAGANAVSPTGREELPYRTNFFIGGDPGGWRTGVRTYHEVVYRNLYDGIDLVYRASESGLKYDLIVSEGAEASEIRFLYEGASEVSLDPNGELDVSTAIGAIHDAVPVAHRDGEPVPCSYVLAGPATVGFRCADRGGRGPLVIDPLVYSTFLGGMGMDEAWGVTVDSGGNAYVTGSTLSPDFPTTSGAFNTTTRGGRDAFVAKLNATGSGLEFSTYLGGSRRDLGYGIAVDPAGNVFVTGQTTSPDFPTTPGAFDRTCGDNGDCDFDPVLLVYHDDAFVAKLNPAGDAPLYATFLGGGKTDFAYSIALDLTGAAYVTGETMSPDFPTTPGAFDRTCGTDGNCNSLDGVNYFTDAFVSKLSPRADLLPYSTFLGGSFYDGGLAVSVDAGGNAYVTGDAQSDDFPTTPGAFQQIRGTDNSGDAFVTKVNPSGSALVYSTFLGGSEGDETGTAIVVDSSGNAYLAGMTFSSDFPTTPGAYDTSFNPGRTSEYDVYVAKLNAAGDNLTYSTFLGGSGQDGWAYQDLAVNAAGEAYVTGITESPDFPTTPGAFDRTCGADGNCDFFSGFRRYDAFLTKFNENGSAVLYSTYFGGQSDDFGRAIAVDSFGDAYVVGRTDSIVFPATSGAFHTTPAGGGDAFVLKFAPLPDLAVVGISTIPSQPVPVGSPASVAVNVTSVGDVAAGPFSVLAYEDRNGNDRFDLGEDVGSQGVASLPVFASAVLSYSWTPAAPGLHRLCAFADYVNVVREGNETNNLLCTDVLAVTPVTGPDYTPANPQPASPVTVGLSQSVFFSVAVANVGNGSADRTTTLAFVNTSSPATPFATFAVPPLAAAETSAPFIATWSSPAIPGTYGIVVNVDFGDDLAEWDETNNTHTWTVDVVYGPVTTLVAGVPNYALAVLYITPATPLSFSVLDQSGTGIRNTTYRVDGASGINYTAMGPFTLAGEGRHFVGWSSEDFAGNIEAVANATIVVDDTPPAIAIDVGVPRYAGTDLFVTSSTPFSLSASDGGVDPVGLATLEYRFGGGPWIPYRGEFTVGGPDGPKEVEVRAADLLGNPTADAIAVVLDDTPPVTTPSLRDGTYPPQTTLALSATDGGSGVSRAEVRVDGGAWTTYAAPLHLSEGHHSIGFRSVDNLNNTEAERLLFVTISSEPSSPPPVEPNWKPLVAAVFATLLAIVGAWSSRRVPWPTGSRRASRAFAFTVLPFVVAEAGTGVVSFHTGLLAIPPLFGAGTAVDLGIFAVGVTVSMYRVARRKPTSPI